MATSNKAPDPAAAALSAIQEALNLTASGADAAEPAKEPELSTPIFPKASDPDKTPKLMRRSSEGVAGEAADSKGSPAGDEDRLSRRLAELGDHPLSAAKRPDRGEDPFAAGAAGLPPLAADRGEPVAPLVRPANDDRHAIGPILRALNKRPSELPQAVAIGFSVGWLLLVSLYFYLDRANIAAHGSWLTQPTTALYLLLAVGPVLFFIVTAMLIRRAQEMRLTARSMAEIAMRLAEPETVATEQIVTLSQAIRREIVSMGDGIERALARAGELETLVRSEVSNLERSYSENERRMKALVDGLSGERENMLNNADRMHDAVASVQESFAQEIDTASVRLAEGLGEAANRVTTSLGAKGEEIRFALGRTSEELVANLLLRGEDMIQRLEKVQQSVSLSLTTTGEAITQGVEQRIGEIDAHLRNTGEALIATITERLDDSGGRIAVTLEDAGGRIATTLGEASERVETTLSETVSIISVRSDQLNERLAQTAQQALTALVGHIDTVQENVGTAAQQALDTFAYQSTALNERFAETIGDAVAAIAMHGDRVNETLADRIARFEEMVVGQGNLVADRVVNEATEMSAMLAGHFEAMETTLSMRGGELETRCQQTTESLDQQIRVFEDRIAARTDEVGRSFEEFLTRIDSGLDGRAKALNETLAARTLEIARILSDGGRDVTQTLEAKISEIEVLLSNRSMALTDTLSTKAAEINLALGGRVLEITETLSARSDEVNQVLGARAREITETLAARTDAVNQVLGARAHEITETFSARTDEVNHALGTRAQEIADTLDERITRFEEHVVGRLDTISSDLDTRGRGVAETLIACATEIDSTLRQHAGTITQVLDHESGQLAAVLTGRADALKELLGQATEDLDTTLAGRTGEIGGLLAARVNEIGAALASRLAEMQTAIDVNGGGLVDLLSSRGGEIAQQVTTVGQFVAQILENRGAAIVEQLGDKQRELTTALDQSSDNLRTALESGAENSVNALVDVNERLRNEIAGTLGEIDERSNSLQEIIGNAGATFGAVETALSAGIQDFQSSIDNITKDIQNIGANTEVTIESAHALYESILLQQQSLAAAAAELARSQAELDRTLDERRASLEALLATVQVRREDFDAVVGSFSASIDDSFERAEDRAREIGTFLAESSQTTSGMVERQFSEIRAVMDNERGHTASLLRAAYEQANAEIETIFTRSTERFQSAAAEMRGLAREVQRELDTTREELHRNAVTLPQETAEQAAVMRRVVADQIKALNELSDVVARSGRAYDLSDPLTASPGRVVEASPPVRRIEPLRHDQVRYAGAASGEPSRPDPLRQRPAGSIPRSPPERNGTGWLSDLLARASRDETEAARAGMGSRGTQQTEALETISQDIARMVDHAEVADAWDRYRRGETNVFSRELYIGRGQQTFDDIRRRYRSDSEFRNTVDRYVEEFERLLADVNRDDRDDTLTRTYLTSETGKVYTMLAHAAGRLG